MKLIVIFLCSFIFSLNLVMAKTNNCLSKDEIRDAIEPFDFEVSSYLFREEIDCDNKNIYYQTVSALAYLKKIESKLVINDNTNILSDGVYNYFKERIGKIVIEDESDNPRCSGNALAYVLSREQNTMHICADNMLEMKFSDLSFSSALLHEARHIDGFSHVHCEHGFYAGKDTESTGACDETFSEQGSYGVGTSYEIQVAHSDVNPIEKQEARSTAVIDLFERFNEYPLDIQEGVIAQSQNGEISFFSDNKKMELLKTNSSDIMTSHFGAPTFFNNNGTVQSYFYDPVLQKMSLQNTPGSFANLFRNVFSQQDQKDLVDVYYSDDYSCFLFLTKLSCEWDSDKIEIVLDTIKPLKFIFFEERYNFQMTILSQDGSIYILERRWPYLKNFTEKDLYNNKYESKKNTLSAATLNGTYYRVNLQGQLYIESEKDEKIIVDQYKGDILKNIFAPFLWSKKIESI